MSLLLLTYASHRDSKGRFSSFGRFELGASMTSLSIFVECEKAPKVLKTPLKVKDESLLSVI